MATRPDINRLSDESLLLGFGLGDADASVAFVRRFQAKVYGLCVTIIRDARLAEDAAQRTFERAWQHATAYDARRGSLQTWLLIIARNLSIDVLRLQVAVPFDPAELVVDLVETCSDPEQIVLLNDGSERLRAALRSLPQDQARAVVMSNLMGLTANEIAEREKIPLGTAKTRVRTALQRLRALFDVDVEGSEV